MIRSQRTSNARRPRAAGVLLLAPLTLPTVLLLADEPLATTTATTTAPAASTRSAPPERGAVLFQPGVWIDWQQREVQVQSRVVLRAGLLEFLACFAGKEHESILRIEASGTHIYMALGLIGLEPGHPPRWDEQTDEYGAPDGDLLDIAIQWEGDGKTRTADAWSWLREVEYARTALPRPWIFAGSVRRPGEASLTADASGVGVAVVDFPDSLICLSRKHSSRNVELWVEANAEAIPPLETPVRLLLRAARPRRSQVVLNARGVVTVDGTYCSTSDLTDLLRLFLRLDSAHIPIIRVDGTLRSDVEGLRRELIAGGLDGETVHFGTTQPATAPVGHPADRGG